MSEFFVTIDQLIKNVSILDENKVSVDNKVYDARLSKVNNYVYLLKVGDKVYDITTTKLGNGKYGFLLDGVFYEAVVRTRLQEAANEYLKKKGALTHQGEIKAPMPGLIIKINKKIGDEVEIGESVLVLEAMKMENDVRSPTAGKIKEIRPKEGASVEKDQLIVVIE